ncbi:MAG: hypothetical protein KGL67_03115 [Patescibacteria group bacterium]|nr:hypothetical protein [Patescibacteria group bacterium]
MKKPFIHALAAALYIVIIVLVMNVVTSILPGKTLLIPMAVLSLFVLSAAVMGFLFLSEPIQLYMGGKQKEAVAFFGKTVGFFACFVIVFLIFLLLKK